MPNLDIESSAVHVYINNLQGVINRMASNSSSAKTWCITLVSAVIVFSSENSKPDAIWIAIIPVSLFLFLDAYYLALERFFRKVFNDFINKLHSNKVEQKDLFLFSPTSPVESISKSTIKALTSFSIWPFYGFIIALLYIYRIWIIK